MDEKAMKDCGGKFEALVRANGSSYWLASDLMELLGYDNLPSMQKTINRSISACATLDIPIDENFIRIKKDGQPDDYKLSRFACYLVSMNGDTKKPQVAIAQAYFASIAERMRESLEEAENVKRIKARSEISEREKSLAGVAQNAGVEVYAFFQNAGYRGMYNMDLNKLKDYKQLPKNRTLLDFMGSTELAANMFRITQTEEKIRNERIRGQAPLENAAYDVGKKVRQTMKEISGTRPEDLPLKEDIKKVHTSVKQTYRRLVKMDKPKQIE